jgi:hypothetical protein
MTTILNTQTATFKFYDEFNPSNKSYYEVTIKVNTLRYEDQKQYYNISYTYNLVHDDSKHIKSSYSHMHPFYENGSISDSAEGDIIYKNDLSIMMIKYLLMSDDELTNYTNLTMPQHYRKNIMLSLSKFWD